VRGEGTLAMSILDLFRGSPQERIARRYIKALRDAGEKRELRYIPAEQVIAVLDEKGARQQVAHMGNLAREISGAPESERDAIYRRYAASLVEKEGEKRSSDYATVKPSLRILLKDETYPVYIDLQTQVDMPGGSKPSAQVYEAVVGDVIACCIEETERGLQFVTEGDLARWGVSAEQALTDAKANVCALPCEVNATGRAHYVFADDSFQSARLVNTDLFNSRAVGVGVRNDLNDVSLGGVTMATAQKIAGGAVTQTAFNGTGDWVAVVPDRDTFFLTSSEDTEGLAGLARLMEKQLEVGARLVSGMPFVLREGRWEVFEPPKEVRVLFGNVARRYMAIRWSDYKGVLEKDLERRGEDIFVASLTVYKEKDSDAYWSGVVWTKGVDTILPAADRVSFYELDTKQTRERPWKEVARVMGERMERLEGLPERYRVKGYPSAGEMLKIGT